MEGGDQPSNGAHPQPHQQGRQQVEGHRVQRRSAQPVLQQANHGAEKGRREAVPYGTAEEDAEGAAHQHTAQHHQPEGLVPGGDLIQLCPQLRQGQGPGTALTAQSVEPLQPVEIRTAAGVDAPGFSDSVGPRKGHGHGDDGGDDKHLHALGAVGEPHTAKGVLHPAHLCAAVQQHLAHLQHIVEQTVFFLSCPCHRFSPRFLLSGRTISHLSSLGKSFLPFFADPPGQIHKGGIHHAGYDEDDVAGQEDGPDGSRVIGAPEGEQREQQSVEDLADEGGAVVAQPQEAALVAKPLPGRCGSPR